MSTPVPRADWPSEQAYANAAGFLGCDMNAIKAVAQVEAGKLGAFLPDGSAPTILFERHVFDRLTNGVFRYALLPGVAPDIAHISDPKPGGYGPTSIQHSKLVLAVAHDREAALKSASWGLFQIMGFNYKEAGFSSLQKFINAVFKSVDDHLGAFVNFVGCNPDLVQALRDHNWKRFKLLYNGPRTNDYASRMADAFDDLEARRRG